MRHLAILTLTILLSVVTLSALCAPLTQPGDPRLKNRQPTTSSQGSIKLTKPPIASITAPGTLVVLHPTQSATGSGLANLRSPATKQVIAVAAMRTKWSQVQEVKDAKASPNSCSAEVSPGHLDVNLPPGVELRSAISRADLVFTDFARWTNPGGGVTIGAQGLTAGAVYVLG